MCKSPPKYHSFNQSSLRRFDLCDDKDATSPSGSVCCSPAGRLQVSLWSFALGPSAGQSLVLCPGAICRSVLGPLPWGRLQVSLWSFALGAVCRSVSGPLPWGPSAGQSVVLYPGGRLQVSLWSFALGAVCRSVCGPLPWGPSAGQSLVLCPGGRLQVSLWPFELGAVSKPVCGPLPWGPSAAQSVVLCPGGHPQASFFSGPSMCNVLTGNSQLNGSLQFRLLRQRCKVVVSFHPANKYPRQGRHSTNPWFSDSSHQ